MAELIQQKISSTSCNDSMHSINFAAQCNSGNRTCASTLEFCLREFLIRDQNGTAKAAPPTQAEIWGYGLLFVLLVSLSSAIGVLFLPLMKKESYEKVLMGMVGLAVGCLCGSAILHLIPKALNVPMEGTEQLDAYLFKALTVIAAIYAFFLTERLLKLSVDHRKRMTRQKKNKLLAVNGAGQSSPGNVDDERDFGAHSTSSCGNGHIKIVNGGESHLSDDSFDDGHGHCGHLHTKVPPAEVKTHIHEHNLDAKDVKEHPIKTVAWMVICGDGIVDGLSMGAAFSISILDGIAVSVAVLCEELPHELGDLAILLNSGMSLKRALLYNFISACTCFAGLIMGILLGELEEASSWIFALAGGMFLYISLVDMLPEMTHAAEEASSKSIRKGLTMLLIQNIGLVIGFVVMYIMARFQDNIKFSQ